MQNNHSLIFFCQRCQHEHDRTHESMFERGIICNHNGCRGWVITPSGRSNIKVKLNAAVYLIRGSVTSVWIGAFNKDEAVSLFANEYDEDISKVVKLNHQAMQETTFTYDPKGNRLSAEFIQARSIDVLVNQEHLPFIFYFIDNETLDEAARKIREEGFDVIEDELEDLNNSDDDEL